MDGIRRGVRADDTAVAEIEAAVQIAEESGDDEVRAWPSLWWVSRWCIGKPRRTVSADWSC